MKEKFLKIINHYGIKKQLKYIHSEYYELDEAILKNEEREYFIKSIGYTNDIAEEIADIMVMLKQIQYYYNIEDIAIEKIMQYKIDRQLERIKDDREKNINS